MAKISDDVVEMGMNRYIELYEIVTGEKFDFSDRGNLMKRLEDNLAKGLEKLS